ncbi:hypothetical protein [Sphingomonas sp. KC8]|uniref:hypothetical protein n=1 Tax=Sphingomonas sp. KC8 TaxID=1030157 RepID=UPI000248A42E|nr:hypothetical protein [Sphingomonas sp. KC8]ARS27621.1 hypothetical protein KC8_09985 [Sphingomonas sp. KC8]
MDDENGLIGGLKALSIEKLKDALTGLDAGILHALRAAELAEGPARARKGALEVIDDALAAQTPAEDLQAGAEGEVQTGSGDEGDAPAVDGVGSGEGVMTGFISDDGAGAVPLTAVELAFAQMEGGEVVLRPAGSAEFRDALLAAMPDLEGGEPNERSVPLKFSATIESDDESYGVSAAFLDRDPGRLSALKDGRTWLVFGDGKQAHLHLEPIAVEPAHWSFIGNQAIYTRDIRFEGFGEAADIHAIAVVAPGNRIVGVAEIAGGIRVGGGKVARFPANSLAF